MKKLLGFLLALLPGLALALLPGLALAQTSNLPADLGEWKLFRNASAPFTIVLPSGYERDTVIVELWTNGEKLSDSTQITESGDTLKFTLTKEQLAPLFRESYAYVRFTADSTKSPELGAKLTTSLGVGVPNLTTRTISLPSKQTVRVSLIGDAAEAILAASQARGYRDSTATLLDSGSVYLNTRKKFGKVADLRANLEAVTFFEIAQRDSVGTFIYDPSDTSTPDDSVLVIRNGTKRFKRQFTGPANIKWWGAKGDSTTNDTQAFNRAFNNPRVRYLFVPRGVYRVSALVLGKGDKTIEFEKGTIIEGLGTQGAFDYLFTIKSTSNIRIIGNGVLFRDNKAAYAASTSGANGAIRIMSSTNVRIESVKVKDTAGDGFYIGTQTFGVPCQDIFLQDCHIDGTYRQGISIINVIGLVVNDCSAINIGSPTGAAPKSGIDFEPNNDTENLSRIRINNFYSENCQGSGILVSTDHLSDSGKVVDIVINNHRDVGSVYNFQVTNAAGRIDGSIVVNNPTWNGGYNNSFLALNYGATAARVEINSPTIINPGTHGFQTAAFLILRRNIAGQGEYNLGNIHVTNAVVKDSAAANFIGYLWYSDDQVNNTRQILNCSFEDPMELVGIHPDRLFYAKESSLYVSDKFNTMSRDLTADITVSSSNYRPSFHNASATGTVVATLENFVVTPIARRVELEVRAAQTLRITTTSMPIQPYQPTSGSYIESNSIGSRVVLEKVGNASAGWWKVVSITGVWKNSAGDIINN